MEMVVHFRAAVALLGRFPALAGVDIEVPRGQIVLLRGPNGAGKTTLLRACAGLVPIVSGEASVLGCDMRIDPRPVRTRVGLLSHSPGLYDDLTVAENVRFWGRAARAKPSDVDAALGLVGLDGRLRGVVTSRLSAGQRRRAALACLLARRPELWLLDEPHAGLDHASRDLLDDLVRQAVRQGATVLFSSHELDRATALADRVVDLTAGTTRPLDGADPTGRGDHAARPAEPAATSDQGAASGNGGHPGQPDEEQEVSAGVA